LGDPWHSGLENDRQIAARRLVQERLKREDELELRRHTKKQEGDRRQAELEFRRLAQQQEEDRRREVVRMQELYRREKTARINSKKHHRAHSRDTFLREQLSCGAVAVEQLLSETSQAGLSWAGVRHAAARLGVIIEPVPGADGGWQWRLPDAGERRVGSSSN